MCEKEESEKKTKKSEEKASISRIFKLCEWKTLRVNISRASKTMRVFKKIFHKNSLFLPISTKWIKYASISSAKKIANLPNCFKREKKIQKSEYFCEHLKFGEDFRLEHYKILVIKKRVKRSFSRLKKARKKKPMAWTLPRAPRPMVVSEVKVKVKWKWKWVKKDSFISQKLTTLIVYNK